MNEVSPQGSGIDRRALLRKAAAAGAIGWAAPVIVSSGPVAAGVFTAKCSPGVIAASAGFVQTGCTNSDTTLTITINFSGPCPCGGTQIWCARKNTPGADVQVSSATLSFSVTVPINGSQNMTGRVALGCADRSAVVQFARYNWALTAFDNGQACNVANSLSAVTFSGRTIFNQATCPPLQANALLASDVQSVPAVPPGYVRPTGP